MLLAAQLALVATKPDSGRPALGTRDQLNACLAGLLVGELLLEGVATPAPRADGVLLNQTGASAAPLLAAAAEVVADKGPRLEAILGHMDRGLKQKLGVGTWDAVLASLVEGGVLAPVAGPHSHDLVDASARDAVIARLRDAAAGDAALEPGTALVLSMTGPAQLLEVVAPDRAARRHARRRIDHVLDGTDLEFIGKVVRRVLADAVSVGTVVITG